MLINPLTNVIEGKLRVIHYQLNPAVPLHPPVGDQRETGPWLAAPIIQTFDPDGCDPPVGINPVRFTGPLLLDT